MNEGNIVLDFTIKTKMDQPEFNFGDIRMAFEDKLMSSRKGHGAKAQEVLLFPVKVLGGTAKETTHVTTSVFVGTISALNRIKDAFIGLFKEDKNNTEEKKI